MQHLDYMTTHHVDYMTMKQTPFGAIPTDLW